MLKVYMERERPFRPIPMSGELEKQLADVCDFAQEHMEKAYLEDAVVFSADVTTMLQRLGAMQENGGWAVYLQNDPEQAGATATVEGSRKIFIDVMPSHHFITESRSVTRPVIRILINETVNTEAGLFLLSHDFIMDEDYDTHYHFDAAEYDAVKREFDFSQNWARKGYIYNEKVQYAGQPTFADIRLTGDEGLNCYFSGQQYFIKPFGSFIKYDDRRFALNWAQDVINQLRNSAPLQYRGESRE